MSGKRNSISVASELLRRARLFQKDDGTPGPFSDQWGWRGMAEYLRGVAKNVQDIEASEESLLLESVRQYHEAYVACKQCLAMLLSNGSDPEPAILMENLSIARGTMFSIAGIPESGEQDEED